MIDTGGPLLLVGCGKMGSALLHGWLAQGLDPGLVTVVEPDPAGAARLREGAGVVVLPAPPAAALAPSTIVFAVKPQAMVAVLPAYRSLVTAGSLVLSIAAGTTIARFEAALGNSVAVVRAMPNTPAAIGRGATVLVANSATCAEKRDLAGVLMAAVGTIHWIDDEAHLHVVTAMSGGGPAYVFLLIEGLANAAVRAGLPEPLALALARETVVGAGALAGTSDEPVATLRRNVTSPGGTTAAALDILMAEDGLQQLFERAIEAAADRSRELA